MEGGDTTKISVSPNPHAIISDKSNCTSQWSTVWYRCHNSVGNGPEGGNEIFDLDHAGDNTRLTYHRYTRKIGYLIFDRGQFYDDDNDIAVFGILVYLVPT